MAEYKVSRSGVVLEYRATLQGNAWIMDELKTGKVEISSAFTLLTAQALSLDAMFTELVGDAAECKPYVESTEAWTRLALKAQTNCRGSLEAMARAADREARRALRENKK